MINLNAADAIALQQNVGLTELQARRICAIWGAKSLKELEQQEPEEMADFYRETVDPERSSLVAAKMQLIVWVGDFHALELIESIPETYYCVPYDSAHETVTSTVVFSGDKLAVASLADIMTGK